MSAALPPLGLVVALPLVGMAIAAWAVAHGSRWVYAGIIALAALGVGAWLLSRGLGVSCAIDESECIGATVVAYGIAAAWLVAAVISLVVVSRVRSAKKFGSESRK
jgi:hypothetical protein